MSNPNEPHPDNVKMLNDFQLREEKMDDQGGPLYPSERRVVLPRPDAEGKADAAFATSAGITLRNHIAAELFVKCVGYADCTFRVAKVAAEQAITNADIFIAVLKSRD